MYEDNEKSTINNANSKNDFGNSANAKRERRNVTEGESIRKRKENTKKRQEKLIHVLES